MTDFLGAGDGAGKSGGGVDCLVGISWGSGERVANSFCSDAEVNSGREGCGWAGSQLAISSGRTLRMLVDSNSLKLKCVKLQ